MTTRRSSTRPPIPGSRCRRCPASAGPRLPRKSAARSTSSAAPRRLKAPRTRSSRSSDRPGSSAPTTSTTPPRTSGRAASRCPCRATTRSAASSTARSTSSAAAPATASSCRPPIPMWSRSTTPFQHVERAEGTDAHRSQRGASGSDGRRIYVAGGEVTTKDLVGAFERRGLRPGDQFLADDALHADAAARHRGWRDRQSLSPGERDDAVGRSADVPRPDTLNHTAMHDILELQFGPYPLLRLCSNETSAALFEMLLTPFIRLGGVFHVESFTTGI